MRRIPAMTFQGEDNRQVLYSVLPSELPITMLTICMINRRQVGRKLKAKDANREAGEEDVFGLRRGRGDVQRLDGKSRMNRMIGNEPLYCRDRLRLRLD